MITYTNNGPELVSTNYWDTPYGKELTAYTANAGTMRLLIPNKRKRQILDVIRDCYYVVVSTLRNPVAGQFAIEFLFEDHSASPYVIHCCPEACLGLFPSSDPSPIERPFTIWTKGPRKLATLRAYSRFVPMLPYMKPLCLK